MSVIGDGDRDLHLSDGSHRWACPHPDVDQDAWAERVAAHQERHRDPAVLRQERLMPQPPPPPKGFPESWWRQR